MARVHTDDPFPFVVPHVPALPVGAAGVSLAVAMRWYWRVRVWKATLSLSGAVVTGPCIGPDDVHYVDSTFTVAALQSSILYANEYTGGPPDYFASLVDTERWLASEVALDQQGTWTTSSDATLDPSSTFASLRASGSIDAQLFGFDAEGNRCSYVPALGLYVPNLTPLQGELVIDNTAGGLPALSLSYPPDPPVPGDDAPSVLVPVAVTVDGVSYPPGQARISYGSGEGTATLTSIPTVSVTLTPVEYWPYIGNDGQTLFDPTTGAVVLRDANGNLINPVRAPFP